MENLCRPYISDRRANLSCKGNTDKTVHFPFITHKSILPRFGGFVKQETVGSFANGAIERTNYIRWGSHTYKNSCDYPVSDMILQI